MGSQVSPDHEENDTIDRPTTLKTAGHPIWLAHLSGTILTAVLLVPLPTLHEPLPPLGYRAVRRLHLALDGNKYYRPFGVWVSVALLGSSGAHFQMKPTFGASSEALSTIPSSLNPPRRPQQKAMACENNRHSRDLASSPSPLFGQHRIHLCPLCTEASVAQIGRGAPSASYKLEWTMWLTRDMTWVCEAKRELPSMYAVVVYTEYRAHQAMLLEAQSLSHCFFVHPHPFNLGRCRLPACRPSWT